MTDNSGNVTTLTWELQSASNGRAKLIWASEVKDALGNVTIEGNNAYEIESNGQRHSMTILFDVKIFADPVSWVGTKM